MKNPLLRWPLLLCLALLATFSFSSCDDDKLPEAKYPVTLRVTGAELTGLGADMRYAVTKNYVTNPTDGGTGTYTYVTTANDTYDLGKLSPLDRVDAVIAFRNVTCSPTPRPGPNTFLRLELLVNGVVVDRAELNAASQNSIACAPFWVLPLTVEGGEFDD